jgi:Domain of Unknown Function (DUF1206)
VRIEMLTAAARLGHLSTGAVHCLVGVLAVEAAIDPEALAMGSQGALALLARRPLGVLLLVALGTGLVADALWQAVRAATDADLAGRGLWGRLERVGWILSGLIHLALGVAALRLIGSGSEGPSGSHTKAWTATVMAVPLGRGLVALAALTLLVAAGVMVTRAGRAALDPWLDLSQMAGSTRALARVLGGLGLATRGIVYTLIAGFLLLAALEANPQTARGVTGTLRAIRLERYGAPLLGAVGVGFVASGLLEMIRARYRRATP